MTPAWTLVGGLYPFAAGAMMLNVYFASLILGWVGMPILSPWAAIWAGVLTGGPAAWIYARHLTRLMVESDREPEEA
ncbi:NnrT protein [Rubellimicrobium roseum]|uniref:NnrT protein n=1 Tax=Rubellimicrobium roseum TaxID=687525 RepID=A0A5C4NF61_9RHOB|nr:NnrT protein [Rubellimicrobium roseum]TNC73273.1 NnrT protein [Rubellimicrobium roseum]